MLGDDIFVNGYFAYPHHTRSPAALWTLSRDIRAWRSDIAIYANETRSIMETLRDGAFLRLCGARRVLGLPLTRRHREHVFAPVTGLYEREAARIARTLEKIGAIDIDKPKNRWLCLSMAERAAAEQIVSGWTGGKRFICFSPGTKQTMKDWTDPNWVSVFERLSAEEPTHGIAVVGAEQDRQRSDTLLAHWRGPHLNVCGQLSPRVSADPSGSRIVIKDRLCSGIDPAIDPAAKNALLV